MFRIQLDCDLQQAAASNPHHSNISASAKLLRVSSSASSILVVYDSTSSFIVDFVLSWDSSTSMLPIGSEVGKQATLESQMSICLSVHYQNPSASQNHTYQPLHASPISIMPMAQLVFHICESVSQISMITSLSAMPKRSLHSQNWLLYLV